MPLPDTTERVALHTPAYVNEEIQRRTQRSVEYYREHEEEIDQRLQQLDQEWDIERVLEANASTLILAGSALGFAVSRKFFAVPLVVSAFLLQHALQGWCPPLIALRRLGFRTATEIQDERDALENIYTYY